MRERRYSPQEVREQVQKLVADLQHNSQAWRKLPYRYICLFCGVPLRSAQPILIQVRAHPNIDYYYQASAVKIPTAICRYVNQEDNEVSDKKFAQFSQDEYAFLYQKISSIYDSQKQYHEFMLHMIFAELLVLNKFKEQWQDLPYGFYAISMGVDTNYVTSIVEELEELHILKRLGISRMFRIALSTEEYMHLEDSAYAKQQEEIVERSQKAVEEEIPQGIYEEFKVLSELNAVTNATQIILDRSYNMNENIVRQQLALRTISDALHALQEKESVYAGMATRIAAISANYEKAITEAADLRQKNNELKNLSSQEDKFYKEQKEATTQHLEAMLSNILSILEEYFLLPNYEKNKIGTTNRIKAQITRIVTDTIGAIEKGKAPE